MRPSVAAGAVTVALSLAGAACANGDPAKTAVAVSAVPASSLATSSAMSSSAVPSSVMPSRTGAVGKAFGPGCAAVPRSGKGSLSAMAGEPIATAASHSPLLSTLAAAIKKADLVRALNAAANITVFAPTNDAFKKIPKDRLDKILADRRTLTHILTYHVVGERLAPDALTSGSFKTLQGGLVTTTGSGGSYKVNDAKVICGNVRTANATVYLIDTVLMPRK